MRISMNWCRIKDTRPQAIDLSSQEGKERGMKKDGKHEMHMFCSPQQRCMRLLQEIYILCVIARTLLSLSLSLSSDKEARLLTALWFLCV